MKEGNMVFDINENLLRKLQGNGFTQARKVMRP